MNIPLTVFFLTSNGFDEDSDSIKLILLPHTWQIVSLAPLKIFPLFLAFKSLSTLNLVWISLYFNLLGIILKIKFDECVPLTFIFFLCPLLSSLCFKVSQYIYADVLMPHRSVTFCWLFFHLCCCCCSDYVLFTDLYSGPLIFVFLISSHTCS